MFIKKPYKIAVIDDSKTVCSKMMLDLQSVEGIEPIFFTDPIAALEQIRLQRIRIVISDIYMPEMNGDIVLRECMALKMGISVFIMSTIDSFMLAGRCMMLGARGFLHKPIIQEELHCVIKDAVTNLDRWNAAIKNIVEHNQPTECDQKNRTGGAPPSSD